MSPEQLRKAESLLSKQELEALRKLGNGPGSRLSPHAAANFYALWLQGYTTQDLAKQNSNFGKDALGLIVRARIEFDWDEQRDQHTRDLMRSAQITVEKNTLEGIQFAADGMAVFHKMVGDRFRKYLQTGEEHHLGDFKTMGIKNYKDLVELMMKMTGLDRKGVVSEAPRTEVLVEPEERKEISAGNSTLDAFSKISLLLEKSSK